MNPIRSARSRLQALASALILAGAAQAFAAPPKDTFVIAANMSSMITLDPAAVGESFTSGFLRSVCNSLIDVDEHDASKLVPGLAESWKLAEDGKTYLITIRRGLKFPSGNPVTAEDVAWSIKRTVLLNLTNAQRLREWDINKNNVEQVIGVVDSHTLRITPTRTWSPHLFPFGFTDYRVASVLDRTEILKHEADGDYGNKWLTTRTACAGPFRVISWKPQELLTLERNDNYGGKKPAIRRIIVRHVPEPGAQRLLLEKGDVDQAMDIDPADFPALEKNPNVQLRFSPSLSINFLMFNMKNPRFNNPKLFEAFRYLIDYQGLEKTTLKNHSVIRQSPVPSGVFGALPTEHMPYKLDLEKAKALLAEAGHPNGFSAELITLNTFPTTDLAEHLQQNAQKIGVNLKISQMINSQAFKRARSRNFDLYLGSYTFNYPDANIVMMRHAYNVDNRDEAKNSLSIAWRASWDPGKWINETIRAAQTETDQAKRLKMYQELQLKHLESSPMIYILQRLTVTALSKNVKTFRRNLLMTYYAAIDK